MRVIPISNRMIIRRIGTWIVLPLLFLIGLSMIAKMSKAELTPQQTLSVTPETPASRTP